MVHKGARAELRILRASNFRSYSAQVFLGVVIILVITTSPEQLTECPINRIPENRSRVMLGSISGRCSLFYPCLLNVIRHPLRAQLL